MNDHYRRGDPETGCVLIGGALFALGAVLTLGVALGVASWLVGRLVDVGRVVLEAPNDGVRWLAALVVLVLTVVYVGVPLLERRRP